MERYRHTQIGHFLIATLIAAGAGVLVLSSVQGMHAIAIGVLIVLGVCIVLFCTLTVVIDREFVRIWFGSGIIRRRFPLKDIQSCRVVSNAWYYGWGIHMTPHGVLYNVSGLRAVEVRMKNGTQFRIGTDVPRELERAIVQASGTAAR